MIDVFSNGYIFFLEEKSHENPPPPVYFLNMSRKLALVCFLNMSRKQVLVRAGPVKWLCVLPLLLGDLSNQLYFVSGWPSVMVCPATWPCGHPNCFNCPSGYLNYLCHFLVSLFGHLDDLSGCLNCLSSYHNNLSERLSRPSSDFLNNRQFL